MSANPLETQIIQLLATTCELAPDQLEAGLTIEELGLDSLDVLKLTYAVEKHFGVNLSAYSFNDISSIGRLAQILREHLGAVQAQP